MCQRFIQRVIAEDTERASRPLVISVINDIMLTMTNVCFAEAKS
jgi:hypothetical protein